MLIDGTTTCLLTETSIQVTKRYFGDTISNTVYRKKIRNNKQLISALNKIQLDTLKDYYANYCIMMTSGNEYMLDFTKNSKKKSIHLHHYYLRALEDIIQLMNAYLPKKHQFHYLGKDEIQNCDLLRMLTPTERSL